MASNRTPPSKGRPRKARPSKARPGEAAGTPGAPGKAVPGITPAAIAVLAARAGAFAERADALGVDGIYTGTIGMQIAAPSGKNLDYKAPAKLVFLPDGKAAILTAQHPVVPAEQGPAARAAEHFFIVTHQAFELWFKQLLLDLADAALLLPPPSSDVEMALDHLVSQSVYFRDPDGNLIEVFVDMPRAEWEHIPGAVTYGAPLSV